MTDSAFRDGRERCLEAVMRSWEDALLPSCPKEQMLKETVATMGRGAEDSQLPSEGEREFREASTFHGSLRFFSHSVRSNPLNLFVTSTV